MQVRQEVKRILFQNILIPLALGVLTVLFILVIFARVRESGQWVQHSNDVLQEVSELRRLVSDAQSAIRGYVITSKAEFLDPYVDAKAELEPHLAQLKTLTRDNQLQQERAIEVISLARDWFAYMERVLETYQKGGKELRSFVQSGEGERRASEIRARLVELSEEELRLKSIRTTNLEDFFKFTASFFLPFLLASSAIITYRGRKSILLIADSYEKRLQENREQLQLLEKEHWIRATESELSNRLLKSDTLAGVSKEFLCYFTENFNAMAGVVYARLNPKGQVFTRISSIGLKNEEDVGSLNLTTDETVFEKVVVSGQPIVLRDFPQTHWRIESGLGSHAPQAILIVPISYYKKTIAFVELAFSSEPDARLNEFSAKISEKLGGLFSNELAKDELRDLYNELQDKSDELQSQQEELRVSNEELEARADLLKESQGVLEAKNLELEEANSLLQDQARNLEEQKSRLDQRNKELILIRSEIESKSRELEKISQYKSQFLANMSHELRTPLNSSMILAQILAENKDHNLQDKQVEYAKQILKSGQDLLALINDILDLSRVESGILEVRPAPIAIAELQKSLKNSFALSAQKKGILFEIENHASTREIVSDRLRVEQILSNLVSNALKFTSHGHVKVQFSEASNAAGERLLRISVEDTGIGIPSEKCDLIFEPFRQADGSITREYGGSGLGLSISKQLAHLLHGHLSLQSVVHKGSTFTLDLPLEIPSSGSIKNFATSDSEFHASGKHHYSDSARFVEDDRLDSSGKPRILLVEDDSNFASLLRDHIRERGYGCIVTDSAEEGLRMIDLYQPSAIVLDINLPDHNGLTVLEQIKSNPRTRHLPVHIVSVDDQSSRALRLGAETFLHKTHSLEDIRRFINELKPVDPSQKKKILIVEDDQIQVESLQTLFSNTDVELICVGSAAEAKEEIKSQSKLDCIVLDLKLPDMTGVELLRQLEKEELLIECPPIIIYTAATLSTSEDVELREFTNSVILKGSGSQDRLIDELSVFLHHSVDQIPAHKRRILEKIKSQKQTLSDQKILLVDDDLRNIFALTASLEQQGAKVEMALNGAEALKRIDGSNGEFDLVLMDIMMPVMDGLQAIKKIRDDLKKKDLPIIALTAKAMKDDRDLCLKAGANDYLSKPVDLSKLTSLIRVWTNKVV